MGTASSQEIWIHYITTQELSHEEIEQNMIFSDLHSANVWEKLIKSINATKQILF